LKIKKRAIEQNKIRFYYYIGSITSILLLVVLISVIYSKSLNQEYQRKITQLSSGIINEKKRFLKNAVDRTINMIESEIELTKQTTASQNMSQDKIEELCIHRIGIRIRNLRLIDNGYIWVNRIVNYDGGDKYAVRQIHPNLPETEGDWLSTNTKDIKGNLPYEVELNGVKKNGEIYFEYYFKKMGSEKIAHKMSYAKLYKPWDWVVATGVYLDDVDQLVKNETLNMKKTLKNQRIHSFSVAIFAIIVSILILIRFEKQISHLIQSYEKDIEDYTNNLLEEKEKTEQALSQVKKLSGLLPICGHCKKIRDDSGYWNQIDAYIQEHSEAVFSHGICQECAKKYYPDMDIHEE